MNPRVLTMLCLALLPAAAGAQVYKCEKEGTLTYTDRPCETGARVSGLPMLIVTPPPSAAERALARAHDDRMAKLEADRDRDDEAWLKEHARAQDRAERVRKAIIERRVIRGMTTEEVRQALGSPDAVEKSESFGSDKETWSYELDGRKRTVNFKDAQVTTTAARQGSVRHGSGRRGRR